MLKVEQPNRRHSRDTTNQALAAVPSLRIDIPFTYEETFSPARRFCLVGRQPDPNLGAVTPESGIFALVAALGGHIRELASTAAELRRVGRQHMED